MIVGVANNAAGTGSNINYIGKHAYVYSGIVGVNNSETTLLDFTTGAGLYIDAKIQLMNATSSNEDFKYTIKANEEIIFEYKFTQTTGNSYLSDLPLLMILAPQTRIQVLAINETSGTPRDHTANITGRVYD
tara:strand:- start:344 stop:739 length:396 start_codon:yes stop_codon:yes gene_type:complete